MSSALRLSIIAVLLLAAAAIALIAFGMNSPREAPVQITEKGPVVAATVSYFVTTRPLPKGTLTRNEDFAARVVAPDRVPAGAIIETPESKAGLTGSLVRKYVEAGSPLTLQDILRPQDRGFLASVLAPESRAISIKVDEESGVSGLIRPGDYVDVVLTQIFDKADPARRALSETILRNVRVIAIDQEIAQGGRQENGQGGKAATPTLLAGKLAQTVSLELTGEQVKQITVAKQLGTLSLAVRAAVDEFNAADKGRAVSSCDVSPELARQNAVAGQRASVQVFSGGELKQYMVRREGLDAGSNCEEPSVSAREAAASVTGRLPEKR
jgi:pilus assembly protein CpaB